MVTFLSELGLLGLIFLLIIYLYLIKSFIRRGTILSKIFIINMFVLMFPLLPSGYFFNNYQSVILYILVGMYSGIKKNKTGIIN